MARNAVKKIKTVRIKSPMLVPDEVQGVPRRILQASSIALRLMHTCGVRTVAELPDELPEHIKISEQDLDLMRDVPHIMLLRCAFPKRPGATIQVCTVCERWALAAGTARPPTKAQMVKGGPATVKCRLTPDCEGVMIKAYMALVSGPDDEPDAEEMENIVTSDDDDESLIHDETPTPADEGPVFPEADDDPFEAVADSSDRVTSLDDIF